MAIAGCLNFDYDFFNKYATLDHYLSRGASGNVYGPIPWNDMQLAIKQVMFADDYVTDKVKKNIELKKDIWTSIEHKHLMRIHSVDLTRLPIAMYIVMEFAAGGSLTKTLRSLGSGNKLSIDVVTNWAKQIAEGMLYLHEKNIVHRDLKSSNILLMESFDYRNSRIKMTLKITDFDEVKEHDHTTTMSLVGTYAYMAPEVLQNQWFSKASDVWSYGVVIWEMLSQNVPHKGLEPGTILYKSVNGELDNLPLEQSFPEDYRLLLIRCWKSTGRERPSSHEIVYILQRMISAYALTEKADSSIKERLQYGHRKYEKDRVTSYEAIYGLAVLDQEVFISRLQRSEIEVYGSTTFCFNRQIVVTGMRDSENLVSCPTNKCLYAFDWSYKSQFPAILRIDPSEGKLIKSWAIIDEGGGRLSIANDTNVILNVNNKAKLHEYTANGQLIRIINLCFDIIKAWLGIKLPGGHYLICHGDFDDPLGRVCLLSLIKNRPTDFAEKIAATEILAAFTSGKIKSTGKQISLKRPIYLCVDTNGSILVSDASKKQAVLLSSNLDKPRLLVSEEDGIELPWRTCFDESSGQWLVADYHRIMVCQVKGEKVERKLYDLTSK